MKLWSVIFFRRAHGREEGHGFFLFFFFCEGGGGPRAKPRFRASTEILPLEVSKTSWKELFHFELAADACPPPPHTPHTPPPTPPSAQRSS